MNTTNKLASLFIEENLKVREEQAEGTTLFLDTQLQEIRTSLEEQETKIQNFKKQYMGELPAQLETNLRILDRLQLDLRSTNELLATSGNRNTTLERQFMDTNEFLSFSGEGQTTLTDSNPSITRLGTMKAELSRLESEYTEKYPEVIRLRKQIKELENQLAEGNVPTNNQDGYIRNRNPMTLGLSAQLQDLKLEISNLKDKRNEITRQIKMIQSRVDRAPTREFELAALSRDYENTRLTYQALLSKKQDAQLSENLEKRQKGEQFRILDPANLPERPFEPDPYKILLLGLAIGLGTGGGLAMFREYLDSSFRKTEDFYGATGLPVLATIPITEMEKTVKHRRLLYRRS
jgi:polysaccharide chain length determinant protein (PEP-CTERM system associated)